MEKVTYVFGIPFVEKSETEAPPPRNRKFVVVWERSGTVGNFSCFARDRDDALAIFRDSPGYFGYFVRGVEEVF